MANQNSNGINFKRVWSLGQGRCMQRGASGPQRTAVSQLRCHSIKCVWHKTGYHHTQSMRRHERAPSLPPSSSPNHTSPPPHDCIVQKAGWITDHNGLRTYDGDDVIARKKWQKRLLISRLDISLPQRSRFSPSARRRRPHATQCYRVSQGDGFQRKEFRVTML